ncbi:hypothetical protein OA2633_08564 [Oceanicaulis sp. HTCC2633]|uniref:hypothetical protein n=1 Tax=Oceanicaulis sp. HTCC2633 TaxID=314254 RepID=UPI000066A1DF|nr:hypothetical protein [Oceanicaulis sp. HTCC2633]EAP90253.1 hypothetical protein OA2633_08564 [Oceanicaulis sp. HTCC2633]
MNQIVAAATAEEASELKLFKLLKADVDPDPFLAEIAAIDGVWDLNTGRQDKIKVQQEARGLTARSSQVCNSGAQTT